MEICLNPEATFSPNVVPEIIPALCSNNISENNFASEISGKREGISLTCDQPESKLPRPSVSSSSSETIDKASGGVQLPQSKKELVTFPKLERVENSIFIINSDAISLNKELDRLASIIKASTSDAKSY